MKKLSTLSIAFILTTHVFSQLSYNWVKTISLNNPISGIETSVNGNVYITGNFSQTTDFDPSSASFFLMPNISNSCYLAKYSNNGSLIWAKEIISEVNSSNLTSNLNISDLVIDASENIYITGTYDHIVDFDPSTSNYTLSAIASNPTAFIVKYNSNGNFIWAKDIKRASVNNSNAETFGLKIALDNNNNIILGAQVSLRPFICKYNNNGNMIWRDSLTSSGAVTKLQSMFVNGLGEIFIGGSFWTDIDMDPGSGTNILSANAANFIGKYSASGSLIWAKKLMNSGSFLGELRGITQDASGNVYTCGIGSYDTSCRNEITKWDNNGNLQWNNYFNYGLNINLEGASDIFLNCNNQIIVIGKINNISLSPQNFDPLGGIYTVSSLQGSCNFISAFNPSNGGIVWAKLIGGDTSPCFSCGKDSKSFIDNSGYIYLSGTTTGSNNDFDPGPGLVFVNLQTTNAFFAKYSGCGSVGIEEDTNITTNNISISPNPSNEKFIFSNLIGENKIEILDVSGRLISTSETRDIMCSIDMHNFAKGLYFYRITKNKIVIKQGRLILQ